MTVLKWLGFSVGLTVVAALTAAALGAWRWQKDTDALRARLEAARMAPSPPRYSERELEGLPAPVQRYFRAVLKDGQPLVAAATIRHSGTFNMSDSAAKWKPFTSVQRVTTQRPGFDWDARIMIFPGLAVYVHDAYVAGSALLRGAIAGLIPVVDMPHTPELARGELMRFVAEAPWYPTALLPSQGAHWEAVDERSARATFADGAVSPTLTFQFHDDGLIDTVRAEARGRTIGGKTVSSPWQGRFWNYAERGGMRVPLEGEVAWILPGGAKPYWRGTTSALSHEFADQRGLN